MKLLLAGTLVLLYLWLATFRFRVALVVYVGFLATALHSVAVLPGQSVIKLAFPALLLGYLAKGAGSGRGFRLDRDLLIWMAAFLGVAAIGVLLAGTTRDAGAKVWQLAGPMALGLVVAAGGRSERTLWLLAWGLVGFSSLSALVAIAQASQLAVLRPIADLTAATDALDPKRMSGPFNNPNGLAAVLSISVPVAAVLFSRERSVSRKVLLGVALTVLGVALVFTYSRSGWIGAVIGTSALLFCRRIRAGLVIPLLLFAATIVVSYVSLGGEESIVHTRVSELALNTVVGVNSMAERLAAWDKAITITREHPVFGIGFGNFPSAQIAGRFRWVSGKVTHNVFMTVLAEMGVLGLGLFVALVVRVFRNLGAGITRGRDSSVQVLSWAFLAATLSCIAGQGLAHGSVGSEIMWVLFGVSFALRSLATRGADVGLAALERGRYG